MTDDVMTSLRLSAVTLHVAMQRNVIARRDIRARGAAAVGGSRVWRSESGEPESVCRGSESLEKPRSCVEVWARIRVGSLEQSVGGGPGVAKETQAGGAALPAVSRRPARSCGESRRELAGRLARPELNRGYSSCRGDGTSQIAPSRHHEGEGSLHGLVGLVRSAKSHAIKTQEVQSDPLVYEGGLFLVYLCESCGAMSRQVELCKCL